MIKISEFVEGYKKGTVPASTLVKMSIFKHDLEKAAQIGIQTAAKPPFFQGVGKALEMVAPFALATAGVQIGANVIHEGIKFLEDKYRDYKLERDLEPMFQKMLMLHPELAEKMDLARLYFASLAHFSRIMADDPLAAGAYIKQALKYHDVAQGPFPATIRELTDIGRLYNQSQERHPGPTGTFESIFMPIKGGDKGLSSLQTPTVKDMNEFNQPDSDSDSQKHKNKHK